LKVRRAVETQGGPQDLEVEIGAQWFRPDLYDRLAEVTLAVPPRSSPP
jgi:DNA-binding NtrC family response regulator